ncbi:MAG: hypothetical protein EBU33_07430 [Sphingobacteriia bacterium]|jgi:hypothetical protein|nr:hypothetical protein [Sphingobacteriia bacterium]
MQSSTSTKPDCFWYTNNLAYIKLVLIQNECVKLTRKCPTSEVLASCAEIQNNFMSYISDCRRKSKTATTETD